MLSIVQRISFIFYRLIADSVKWAANLLNQSFVSKLRDVIIKRLNGGIFNVHEYDIVELKRFIRKFTFRMKHLNTFRVLR